MAEVYVPEEILVNIFIRLPTKPLVRFKCLSKHWNRVISSDHNFMKSRSRRMIILPSEPLLAIDNTHDMANTMIKLPSFENSAHFTVEVIMEVIVVGTINGVVLIAFKRCRIHFCRYELILYNPFTGESKQVPDPPKPLGLGSSCYDQRGYGFGNGKTSDDIKIVRLQSAWDVFDVKTWSWSRHSILDHSLYVSENVGTFLKGFLYWSAYAYSDVFGEISPVILVFDIKKMVVSYIRFDQYGFKNSFTKMGTLNQRLCVICYKDNLTKKPDLWVMKEDGSWLRVRRLKKLSGSLEGFYPLSILDDGKLVISKHPNQLLIYDMFKNSHEEVIALTSLDRVLGTHASLGSRVYGTHAVEYVESLISPSDICSYLDANYC